MLNMDIPPIVIVGIQAVLGMLTALILWVLTRVATDLKENTANTISLAKSTAVTDTKVEGLVKDMVEIRPRIHKMAEQVTVLETTEKVRKEMAAKRRRG